MLEPLNHAQVVGAPELWSNLIRWRRSVPETPPPGVLEAVFAVVTLRLLIGEALMQDIPAGAFDAIYFDAFSPSSNPELWTESFLAGLFTALRRGGTLSTYSASGRVRRSLAGAGFEVEKVPGPPGGKRDMTVARRLTP